MGLLPGHFAGDVLPVIQRHPDLSQAGDLSTRLRAGFRWEKLTTKYCKRWGNCVACSGLESYPVLVDQLPSLEDKSDRLTRIANVAFHPPSICCRGSKPQASLGCRDECQTLLTTPPGTPSKVWLTGVLATASNHCARIVAEADWRGTLRCKVLKERRRSHDSSEPITLPRNVRS